MYSQQLTQFDYSLFWFRNTKYAVVSFMGMEMGIHTRWR